MTLIELKSYLQIKDDSQDNFLELSLNAAADYVKAWTNNSFAKGMPPGVKMGIATIIGTFIKGGGIVDQRDSTVKSEKIDGLQVIYFSPQEMQAVAEEGGQNSINYKYFLPYRKIKLV